MKVLVIGGVAAGTKAAAKLKRMDRSAQVTIVTKGKDISYAGCGLPYYVGGVIVQKEQLIVNTPEKYAALTGAQVLTEREATALDPIEKTVAVKNLRTGEEENFPYDKCVIAVGASAIVPRVEGALLPGVFQMRTPEDAIAVREYLEQNPVKKAVVAGGGFIGLEVAENLAGKGVAVTVIDMADQIMPGFDPEIAGFAQRHLKKKGIRVLTGTKLEAIAGGERAQGVKTDAGELAADLVIMSLGIRPNTAFLKEIGMIFAPNGAIVVDGHLHTNLEDIYAAGDCAMVTNRQTGKSAWAPMGSSANMEGRVLAQAIGGEGEGHRETFPGVLGTAVVKLPELSCGRTGLSEVAAKAEGMEVITNVCVVDDKAHYYPGAASFIIKLVAEKATGKFLGVQVLGPGAIDKITDIGVVAITMGATLEDLSNMDMAYAPPFSTAIHPFVTAVNVLKNKRDGILVSMTPAQFAAGEAADYRIVDAGLEPSIPGAARMDVTEVEGPVEGFAPDEELLLVCAKGKRAYLLQNRLRYYGYSNTKVLEGGLAFNVIPKITAAGKTTVSPEEITRVKALGFLHNKGTDCFNCRVITRNGRISAEENQAIAEAAKKYGDGHIAMTTRLTMEITGVPFEKIDELRDFLADRELETGGTGSKVRPVVACKGTTCQYGLLDSFELSEKIHEKFYQGFAGVKLPHKFKIAVGGCPNNCVKPDLNDLGVVGQRIPQLDQEICRGCNICQVEKTCPMKAAVLKDGKLVIDEEICNNCGRCVGKCPFHALEEGVYGYRIYIGGRWGKKYAHGQALERIFFSEEEVLDVIEKAILLFREQGRTGERFADTIARLGFEEVQSQLLGGDLLRRRDEILGMQVHLVGGATC